MNTIIEMNNVTKKYGDTTIVTIDELAFEKGKIYGIIGRNGAGKTSLFKLISGLKSPSTGMIELFGKTQDLKDRTYLQKMGINIDTPRFYEHISGFENLKIHLQCIGIDKSRIEIEDTLRMVGLDPTNKLPVSKYSLGMKQRLAIARAMSHDPEVLLLDEPLNGLDPMGAEEIKKLLVEIAHKEGTTILISSHIIAEMLQFIDEMVVVTSGEIALNKSIDALRQAYGDEVEIKLLKEMEGKR